MELKYILFLCVHMFADVSTGGPLCFSCSSIQHSSYCDYTEQCADHQLCHITKVQTSSGHFVFNSGCVNSVTCDDPMRIVGQHVSHGNVTCIDCCHGNMCNNNGCGDPGPPLRPNRGPYCFQCDHMENPSECEQLTICEIDEVCAIEEHTFGSFRRQFLSGCKRREQCNPNQILVGRDIERRRVDLCNSCCHDDFCNRLCEKHDPVSTASWTSWGSWSSCSPTGCTPTNHTRNRTCIDTITQQEMGTCAGPATETRRCPSNHCQDCRYIYNTGIRKNGVYIINPEIHTNFTFEVYCDMDDGGWNVIQKRFDGHLNFTKPWSDYKNGFGSLDSEFWLGLDNIYHLTNGQNRSVKFVLEEYSGAIMTGTYENFYISDEAGKYNLHVGSLVNGTIPKYSFTYNSGRDFATYDRDSLGKCADRRHGGWWYKSCTYLNINGKYGLKYDESGVIEHYSGYHNFRATTMKVK